MAHRDLARDKIKNNQSGHYLSPVYSSQSKPSPESGKKTIFFLENYYATV